MVHQKNSTTEEILADLYAIDPALKNHEREVRRLVARLQKARPVAPLDEAFVRRLKTDLVQMGAPIQSKKSLAEMTQSFFGKLFGHNMGLALSGALALLMILVIPLGVIFEKTQNQSLGQFNIKNFSFTSPEKQSIEFKPENAFGTLPLAPTSTPLVSLTSSSTSTATTSADAFSLDGLPVALDASSTGSSAWLTPPAGSLGYDGSLSTLAATTTPVLRRVVDASADTQLSSLLQGMNFDLADLSSFSGLSLRNIEVSEDQPFGYTISVNADTGNITISENASRWLPLNNSSATPLSNDMAISIATNFFKVHNIDISSYGTPSVVPSTNVGSTEVLFPLVINGQAVYNQDGTPYGISVSIDDQLQKVTAAYNITSQTYEASKYALETDPASLLNYLGATTTTAASSTDFSAVFHDPQQILARYVTSTGTSSSELFVPAFLFPVTKSDPTAGSESFVLPLVKDLLPASSSTISS